MGHDVDTVAAEGIVGADDDRVLHAAAATGRVVVSLDRGLGDRVLRNREYRGVIVVRPASQNADDVAQLLASFLRQPQLAGIEEGVAVLEPTRVRFRAR